MERGGEKKDNMALFFFSSSPASIPSSSPQVHCESDLVKPFPCQQVMNHLISRLERVDRKWKSAILFYANIKAAPPATHRIISSGFSRLSHRVNEQPLLRYLNNIQYCTAVAPHLPTPCLSSVGIMVDLAGEAYSCNKSSSGVYRIARYKL